MANVTVTDKDGEVHKYTDVVFKLLPSGVEVECESGKRTIILATEFREVVVCDELAGAIRRSQYSSDDWRLDDQQ